MSGYYGEKISGQESIYNCFQINIIYYYFQTNIVLPIKHIIVSQKSSVADKLYLFMMPFFGYAQCKFDSALEAALMFKDKSFSGEKQHDC